MMQPSKGTDPQGRMKSSRAEDIGRQPRGRKGNTMKQYYITSNVNDRNEFAKTLADGEEFRIWFTTGVVRNYDGNGNLISVEQVKVPDPDEVEYIDPTTEKIMTVQFSFGSVVTLSVTIHEGITLDESLCIRGGGDIERYRNDSGEWVECSERDYSEVLQHLTDLRDRTDAADIVATVSEKVSGQNARSAWSKGVKAYAEELLEELKEAVEGGYVDADDLCNRRLFECALLNGASDWRQYSEGGCSLIYDRDIAERLCTASELKRTDNGLKDPNPRENWIACQGRALYQAANLILSVAF